MLDEEDDEGSAMRRTQVDSWAPAESSWREERGVNLRQVKPATLLIVFRSTGVKWAKKATPGLNKCG